MQVVLRLLAVVFVVIGMSKVAHSDPIEGSGSTFAFPFLSQMSRAYLEHLNDGGDYVSNENGITYEPIGSLGGILRLERGSVDFAASDFPVSSGELQKFGLIQFPIVAGGIVPVVNLRQASGSQLRLSGHVLAEIYLGNIQAWNDPAIEELNAGLALPDLRITVVHRSDGSGSTFNWTSYLSQQSNAWKAKYGADTLISWPLGTSAEGSSGIIATVKSIEGAIGYLEFGQAKRSNLATVMVQNAEGAFVLPDATSMSRAIVTGELDPAFDFSGNLVSSTAADAYPITVVTYGLMRANKSSNASTSRTGRFFRFLVNNGAAKSAELNYIPLPKQLIEAVNGYLDKKLTPGS